MINGLITSLRTLSSIPIKGKEAEKPVNALPWFPVTGLILGTIAATISCLSWASTPLWTFGLALLLVLTGILLTRGLHLDGLADWADGFWGGNTKDEILRIMKDPHTGTFGILAIFIILMAKWIAYVCLTVDPAGWKWIATAYTVSRTMQVDLICTWHYARENNGKAARFFEGAGYRQLIPALLICTLVMIVLLRPYWLFMITLPISWLATRLFGLYCSKKIGGITGDTIGACNEIIETGTLFIGAFLGTQWTL